MHDSRDIVTVKKQNLTGKAAETRKRQTCREKHLVTRAIQDLFSIDSNIFYSL